MKRSNNKPYEQPSNDTDLAHRSDPSILQRSPRSRPSFPPRRDHGALADARSSKPPSPLSPRQVSSRPSAGSSPSSRNTALRQQATSSSKSGDGRPDGQNRAASQLHKRMNVKPSLSQNVEGASGSKIHGSSTMGRLSPAVEESFAASPLDTSQTTDSTESTESNGSVRTIRGANLGDTPLRTPSYPFPYVPSRTTSMQDAPLHQPFTALSPSSPSIALKGQARTRDRFRSHAGGIMERGTSHGIAENKEQMLGRKFPTPDLYDLVLALNSELNLESWWARLITIMREEYRVHRLSLAVPVDATDIENVPWGQKAAYNARGLRQARSTEPESRGQPFNRLSLSQVNYSRTLAPSGSASPSRVERPPMESRHSYSGFEARRGSLGDESRQVDKASRPKFSRWVTSDIPVSAANFAPPPNRNQVSARAPSSSNVTESEFTAGSKHSSNDPCSLLHKSLYALSREDDPLLDAGGVNRVLERGSAVLLTREFQNVHIDQHRKQSLGKIFGASQTDAPQGRRKSSLTDYEDYEQHPATPWSESPAPSPAPKLDPETNPFFSPGVVSEDAFEPTSTEIPDYSQGFEAIGVEDSSTLVHLPLIHPTLSKAMSRLDADDSTPLQGSKETDVADVPGYRKSPIAMLSIMSDAVPYPRNWYESLESLGPHLATSFHTCCQNSMISERLERALDLQSELHQGVGRIANIGEPFALGLGLDSLLQYDNDDTTSTTIESLTSPSEGTSIYSGHSIAGSPAGTPGLTAHEPQQSYFDLRNRQSLERSRSGSVLSPSSAAMPLSSRIISGDHRSALRSLETPRSGPDDRKKHESATTSYDRTSTHRAPTKSSKQSSHTTGTSTYHDSHEQGSTLHSRGADFKTSFPTLPLAASRSPARSKARKGPQSPSLSEFNPVGISDNLIRILIDAVPVQIFMADPENMKITWVNSKFLAYGGLAPAEAYSTAPWDIVHPEEVDRVQKAWSQAVKSGQQLECKARMRRFDGNWRHQYLRGAPLRTTGERIVHWICVIADFHDQYCAEVSASKQQETAQSEAKYMALANSSPQVVFAVTRLRGIIFCNSQWQAYSGQSEEEALGAGFMEAVHSEDLTKCKLPSFDEDSEQASNVPISMPSDTLRSRSSAISSSELSGSSPASGDTVLATSNIGSPGAMQMPQRQLSQLADKGILKASRDATGNQSYSTEVRLRNAMGEYRWHLVRLLLADPLVKSETSEETWYGTCTDINDHKELEQTLKETMDAKSRFLSNMSHEIRTPLNGIMGMTSFLIDSKLTADQSDHVNVIRGSTEGLRDLINDILDLSKVEAGMITLNMDWFHFRGVLEDVVDLTSPLALDKGIELNYLVDRYIPSMVKGDRFRFRQILLNVIGNAIKFTQEGEVYVSCKKVPMLPEDIKDNSALVQIDILDTGSGFSERERDMLFKRFSQIDGSSTRQHGGSGLGLVISMQLVTLHGGEMSATSTVGEGSCFTFSLRFSLPTVTDRPPNKPLQSTEDNQNTTSRQRSKRRSPSAVKSNDKVDQTIIQDTLHESPAAYPKFDHSSPASTGSEHSMHTAATSRVSSKSSQSSFASMNAQTGGSDARSMRHDMVSEDRIRSPLASPPFSSASLGAAPRLYSVLIVCPLQWTREAIKGHLDSILDARVPHNVTLRATVEEASDLLYGEHAANFTHVILDLKITDAILRLTQETFRTQSSSISVVIACNTEQKKQLKERIGELNLTNAQVARHLLYVQKPVKPSRLALIFDPEMERESSTDTNKSSHVQVAAKQKQVFSDMTTRLGHRGLRVLLVEDNKINQMVILQLFKRTSVTVDTVQDGVQATDKVLKSAVGHYSMILMDLMMPNKDGYESCQEIRAWEQENSHPSIPIIALSANVLDDVWQKCRKAGFNSYITKPLQFEELRDVMVKILDPEDPDAPLDFMGMRRESADGKKAKH